MTGRAGIVIFTAALLWFFANQTQVGWLYVMAAAFGTLLIAAWWVNRGMLRQLVATRRCEPPEHDDRYEGEAVTLTLAVESPRGVAQLALREVCPVAPPDDRARSLFIPSLPGKQSAQVAYTVELYQRGKYQFGAVQADSRAPFGLFRQRRQLAAPLGLLVYPEVRELTGLALLDRRYAVEVSEPRAGRGSEVIGVREYRTGDSPRHIHWRTVARTGRLATREYADEAQPGLTLALDVFAHGYPATDDKHTPFEWVVKVAASIGEYALRMGYPLYLLADEGALPAPRGAVSYPYLMDYLAQVQPTGQRSFREVVQQPIATRFLAAVLPWPNAESEVALGELQAIGERLMTVSINPASFPAGGPTARALDLRQAVNLSYVVEFGMDYSALFEREAT